MGAHVGLLPGEAERESKSALVGGGVLLVLGSKKKLSADCIAHAHGVARLSRERHRFHRHHGLEARPGE